MLKKKDLVEYFYNGIKSRENMRIGVEHEKFIINKKTLKPLSYEEPNGIKDILIRFTKNGWQPIYDDLDKTIIAVKKKNESITLEPGGQIELSGAQLESIHQTCAETNKHLSELKKIGEEYDFILLGMGVEPNLNITDFPWIPKQRYKIMKKYMPKVGKLGHHMMQRTCTNQVNLDFFSEEDMKLKYRLILNLEAIATGIFANSPFDNSKISKFKSLRSHFWHNTDPMRTGITPFVFNDNFTFETYVDYALDVPMYFIERNSIYIDMTKYTFRDFLVNFKSTNDDYTPTIKDWENHLSTLFPQVRLKKYLEIRSMDACSWELICTQPAFWVGIIYDDTSFNKAMEIVDGWTQTDREYLNQMVPVYGLKTKFKNSNVLEVAQELFNISKSGLKRRNILSINKEFDETIHFNDLEENLTKGLSPADKLIDKFKTDWNHSTMPIYKEKIY